MCVCDGPLFAKWWLNGWTVERNALRKKYSLNMDEKYENSWEWLDLNIETWWDMMRLLNLLNSWGRASLHLSTEASIHPGLKWSEPE